jgi:ribonuclease BN (tRNA processing enzyme)
VVSPTARTVTVLGCDGSYPSPGGAASGYLIRAAGGMVLLDAGPGTFANLQRLADPSAVDAVVLSHEHPDHWTDLESLAVWLRLGDRGEPPGGGRLPVLAPPGLRRRSYFADDEFLEWREVEPEARLQLAGLQLQFGRTDHGPPTLAVRMDAEGGSLAYSADSGPEWTVASLGSGVRTFLCEATYTREHEGSFQHMSGRQAGAMAGDAGVGRLVLTHRWPTVSARAVRDEAESSFGGAVDQATVGATFEW